jgi:hypothetical protein
MKNTVSELRLAASHVITAQKQPIISILRSLFYVRNLF